ncbi:hypothetical protein SRHO_G00170300 [Serrasalmus rhombeus]
MTDMVKRLELGHTAGAEFTPLVSELSMLPPREKPCRLTHPFRCEPDPAQRPMPSLPAPDSIGHLTPDHPQNSITSTRIPIIIPQACTFLILTWVEDKEVGLTT